MSDHLTNSYYVLSPHIANFLDNSINVQLENTLLDNVTPNNSFKEALEIAKSANRNSSNLDSSDDQKDEISSNIESPKVTTNYVYETTLRGLNNENVVTTSSFQNKLSSKEISTTSKFPSTMNDSIKRSFSQYNETIDSTTTDASMNMETKSIRENNFLELENNTTMASALAQNTSKYREYEESSTSQYTITKESKGIMFEII